MMINKSNYIIRYDYRKIIKITLICICCFIPFININKGLDVADTGYILNSYEFIFKNPESINFSIILTSIFGNIILNILNLLNIPSYLGLKIVAAIFSLVVCWIILQNLKKYFDENILLIGIMISLLLARGHISILMYTNLSAFILAIASILLINGIIEGKDKSIFISGLLIGINVLVRISNLVQIILIFSIIYYGWKNKNKQVILKGSLIFLSGVAISLIISLLCIILYFGKSQLISMINIYFQESINSTDSHSIMDSIKINLNQGLNGLFWIGVLWGIGFTIDYLFKGENYLSKKIYIIYAILAILPIVFVILKYFNFDRIIIFKLIYKIFYSVYQPFSICVAFYCLITLYWCFIKKENSIQESLILIIGFLSMISLPMGSNQGFAILYQGFYLQGAILSVFVYKILLNTSEIKYRQIKKIVNPVFQKGIIIFVLIYFLSMLLTRNITYTYRDNSNLDKFTINNYKFKGIYTTEQRAKYINELLDKVGTYIDENTKLITYGSIPIFSYVLDMPPFFNGFNGWIEMGQLSIDSMKETIDNSIKEENFPLIILSNVGTNNSEWPNSETIKIMEKIKGEDNKYFLIQEYIIENNYSLLFKNEVFEVYYID